MFLMENRGTGFVMPTMVMLSGSGDEFCAAGLAAIGIDGVGQFGFVPDKRCSTKFDGFNLFNVATGATRTLDRVFRARSRPLLSLIMLDLRTGIHQDSPQETVVSTIEK